jgi:hypothetical protein
MPAARQWKNDLADGQEVEIASWRPRWRDGLSYQIRRLSDGLSCPSYLTVK